MKTGLLGLGAMGIGMAMRLYKAGHLFSVWNRTVDKAESFARQSGVALAETPARLAEQCDLIITSVSRDADIKEVASAMLPGLGSGKVVADTSTVGTETARQIAAMLNRRNADFLDCPVSGGVEGARNGTLAMMVGGDARVLERVTAVLSSIASNITHMGPTGSGQATKAVNQIMAAGINQAVTEALAFAQAMDLPMDKVIEVVTGGAAANWFLSHRGETMVKGSFDPGFKVNLHHKDLEICRDMARAITAAPLPLVEMTLAQYEQLMADGRGDEDISALFRIKRAQYGQQD